MQRITYIILINLNVRVLFEISNKMSVIIFNQ